MDERTLRLFAALRRGETRALARAISLVEDNAAEAQSVLELCRDALSRVQRTIRIGITGPAGAGKSTLINALTRELRAQSRNVGIVAVDPSSAFSGGAILGDRIRIGEPARENAVVNSRNASSRDTGVYMRSMATRGHLGGLAKATEDVLTVIEAAFPADNQNNFLLIETTGVGQGEIEVVRLADIVAVVLVPGMGDSVQSLKAGILEIASVFALNKSDREGADRLESEIGEMLTLSAAIGKTDSGLTNTIPEIVKTVATSGEGVPELLQILDKLASNSDHEASRRKKSSTQKLPKAPSSPVLDHIGIAVRSISDSFALYQAIGLDLSCVEEVPQERVRVAMMSLGDSRIELLEAIESDSPIGKFIDRRGEGLHHIALRVPDLAATIETLQDRGVRLVSSRIQDGAGGHRYIFVHPASANGVLIELVESPVLSLSNLGDRR